jgi:hypothetical protein
MRVCRACRYGIGQQYNDHWDWFDQKTLDVRVLDVACACSVAG